MYVLDSAGEVLFDEEKGLLIVRGNRDASIQLQQQQRLMLKSLCEREGKVVTYGSLFQAVHDEAILDFGDKKSVANDVQTKIYEIRRALEQAGIKDASQLISTNRSVGGYEIHLPSIPESAKAANRTDSVRNSRILSSTPLISGARVKAFYQERPYRTILKSEIVQCEDLGDGEYLFEFHLSRLDYIPRFISVAIVYWEDLDLEKYFELDCNAAFCFDVDNIDNVLASIAIEFKTGDARRVFYEVDSKLVEGTNSIRIPLSSLPEKNSKLRSRVCEICFVVHPETMNADDGKIIIKNIKVG